MTKVPLYHPDDLLRALGDRPVPFDEFHGPSDERPINRTTEDEAWARCLQKILDDPRRHLRPGLYGTAARAIALRKAVASMPNFDAVTGVIERAIIQSARTRQPVRFPPILIVSPPGLGKTYYCRTVAKAMATTCVPIAINGTSDRGALGGLATSWRGAKLGKIATALLFESRTASPLFLLDEIDKPPELIAGENTLDILLSALEPENARAFIDEYLTVPIRLDGALWIASANDTRSIPEPLLSRMIVVDVPKPTPEQARLIVAAIAAPILAINRLKPTSDEAVLLLLNLSARQMRQLLEMAAAYAVYDKHDFIKTEDMTKALTLIKRREQAPLGFLG